MNIARRSVSVPYQRSPILDTFDVISDTLSRASVDPRSIEAGSSLDTLLPKKWRRAVWRELQGQGLDTRELGLPWAFTGWLCFITLAATGALAFFLNSWFGLLALYPIGMICYRLSRPWAVCLPVQLRTVGELAVYVTRFRSYKDSGYRWSADEIALKVRMLFAEHVGIPLERVQRENRMADIENW